MVDVQRVKYYFTVDTVRWLVGFPSNSAIMLNEGNETDHDVLAHDHDVLAHRHAPVGGSGGAVAALWSRRLLAAKSVGVRN